MSPSPLMIRCAATAIVCSPDEQNRLIVMPAVVTGQPARMAICRAMLRPVAPSGLAQPMITSSISAASRPAHSIAQRSAWPPMVAPWVMLRAPRQLLQSGVRAVETMTASVLAIEFLSFLREFHEKRRRFPDGPLIAIGKGFDPAQDLVQPDGIRVEHRPAAVGREAVAGEVNHVDVRGAQRDAFLEDLRAFVDQRVDEALHDFLVGNRSRLDPLLFPVVSDDPVHFGIGDGFPISRLIEIPALAGLLPEAAELRDPVAHLRIDEVGALLVAALADLPADVEARHVAHLERAHREAPLVRRGV